MSCIQSTPYKPAFDAAGKYHSPCSPSTPCMVLAWGFQLHTASLKLKTGSSTFQDPRLSKQTRLPKLREGALRHQHSSPICLFGSKEQSENGKDTSPWKAFEKAVGNLKKEKSIEDVLREQIEKQEYSDNGGNGRNRPGGGGGGSDGSGGSEDEGLSGMLDELTQVILGAIAFIFLYIFIIEGEDITVLVKDIIKFLFGGQKSIRLKRLMYELGRFYQRLTRKKREVEEPYWLERAILNTTTCWDSPEKYKYILRAYLKSRSEE